MVKMSREGVVWSDLLPSLTKVVRDWEPAPARTEREYRDALAEHLRLAGGEFAHVEVEYRDGGTTADILFQWNGLLTNPRVFFELKRNLSSKSELDRLVGQIELLEPGKRQVIVVLCGETRPDLLGRLRERYKALEDETWRAFAIVEVVPKG